LPEVVSIALDIRTERIEIDQLSSLYRFEVCRIVTFERIDQE